jgi:CTP-dependent riboflavin kinase
LKLIKLRGKLVKGFGVGGRYVSHPYYSSWFEQFLGCKPFPGTLNFDAGVDWRELASACKPKVIPEIIWDRTRLGAVYVWSGKVETRQGHVNAAIIRPLLSRHPPTVLEVVACIQLKPLLNEGNDRIMVLLECIESEGLRWRERLPEWMERES